MSGDNNVFDFKGLSGDEELERLLESVRRDIGEASPEPKRAEARPEAAEARPGTSEARSEAAGTSDRGRPERQPRPERRAQPAEGAPAAQRAERPPRPKGPQPPRRPGAAVETPERPEPPAERELPPQRERIRVVHPEDEPRERKSRFGLALGIFSAALAIVLAAGCALLWFYLDAYEVTRPGRVMENFAALADDAYWADAVDGAFVVGETPFETREELMDELCLDVLRDNPLSWCEDEGYGEGNMAYIVSAGGRDVCRVTLGEVAENGSAGFGFTYLEVKRVELLAEFIAPQPHEIDIAAPAGAAVSVNGVAVTPDYIADGAAPEVELPELEQGRADELYVSYHIGGLYAPVEVAAGVDGAALEAAGEPEGGSVVFALGEGTLDYRILVPEGASVSVNGVELDESYNTGDTVVPALLEGFEDYGSLPELELWLVEGLHIAPEVEVRGADGETLGEPAVNGTELAYFGGGDETLAAAHEAEAEAFAEAYAAYLSGEAASDADYEALQAMVLDGSALSGELEELRGEDGADGRDVKRVRVRDGSFTGVGATCFVCTADVQYAPAEEGGENVEAAYTIVFVMNGGVWLAASVVS